MSVGLDLLPIAEPVSSSVPALELARRAYEASLVALVGVRLDEAGAYAAALADMQAAERELARLEREALGTAMGA